MTARGAGRTVVAAAVGLASCLLYALGAAVGWERLLPSGAARWAGALPILAALVAAGSCLAAVIRREVVHRVGWVLLAVALVGWATAAGVRWWQAIGLEQQPALPSWSDAGFLVAAAAGAAAGFAFGGLAGGARGWVRTVLDGWILAGSLMVLGWTLALRGAAESSALGSGEVAVVVAAPLLDALVLAVLVAGQLRGTPLPRRACLLLVTALGLLLVSDTAHARTLLSADGDVPAEWLSVGWFSAFVVLAVAAVSAAPGAAAAADPDESRVSTGALMRYFALGASALAVGWQAATLGRLDAGVLVVTGLVLAAVMVRQGLALLDERSLLREVARRERHFRSVVHASSDVLVTCSPDGRIRYVSPAATTVLGFGPSTLSGTMLPDLVHPEDAPQVRHVLERLASGSAVAERVECRVRTVDRSWRHTESVLSRQGDELMLNVRDVSERVAQQERLAYVAFHDSLTGLPNRARFLDRVQHALDQRDGGGDGIAVAFLDLDGFKAVNDSAGHAAGDQVLVETAARLRHAVRIGDTVARFGGDEFAVLLERDCSRELAAHLADRILSQLAEPFRAGDRQVSVSASVGVAFASRGVDVDELMRNADLAMYRAKATGKGRAVVLVPEQGADSTAPASPDGPPTVPPAPRPAVPPELPPGGWPQRPEARFEVQLEGPLQPAATERGLALSYEPIVDLPTGAAVALAAMPRSEGGHQEPSGEPAPAAARTGDAAVGRLVMGGAVEHLAEWSADGRAVNVVVALAAGDVENDDIVDCVREALEAAAVPPHRLTIALPEGKVADVVEHTFDWLRELQALGVRLMIDDFGTAPAGLDYLRRVQVDALRMNQTFLAGLGQLDEVTALVATIIRLGRDLGLTVVAAGVVDPAQLEQLQRMGCHQAQGPVLSGPLSAEEAPAALGRILVPAPAPAVIELPLRDPGSQPVPLGQ